MKEFPFLDEEKTQPDYESVFAMTQKEFDEVITDLFQNHTSLGKDKLIEIRDRLFQHLSEKTEQQAKAMKELNSQKETLLIKQKIVHKKIAEKKAQLKPTNKSTSEIIDELTDLLCSPNVECDPGYRVMVAPPEMNFSDFSQKKKRSGENISADNDSVDNHKKKKYN